MNENLIIIDDYINSNKINKDEYYKKIKIYYERLLNEKFKNKIKFTINKDSIIKYLGDIND